MVYELLLMVTTVASGARPVSQ